MGGVKTRRKGETTHRFWYEKGTDTKLVHVLRITNGKRSWFWAAREDNNYREVPSENCELK